METENKVKNSSEIRIRVLAVYKIIKESKKPLGLDGIRNVLKEEYNIESGKTSIVYDIQALELFEDVKYSRKAKGYVISSQKEKLTKGDAIRRMTDEQLAEFVNGVETDAYNIGREGESMPCSLGKKNIKFYTGYFGSPEGEDY